MSSGQYYPCCEHCPAWLCKGGFGPKHHLRCLKCLFGLAPTRKQQRQLVTFLARRRSS